MEQNLLIIGGGVAAVNAAKAIRDYDQESRILIFGEEALLPYNRMKLSKELYSNLYDIKNQIKKEKWYEKNKIEFCKETKIVEIDSKSKVVVTDLDERIPYHKLLLCMGAHNRPLSIDGGDRENVFTIRGIQDSDRFKAYIEDKNHVALIGGGIQNLELACSLVQAGKSVSVIEATSQLMGRQLDAESASMVKTQAENKGVSFYFNATVRRITDAGVEINDGQVIPSDAVVYSVGIIPNTELVEGITVEINRGIVVNEKMETTITDIYAAGDVTEFNQRVSGLWGSALEQGIVAGTNMVAAETISYTEPLPVTILQAFELSLFSLGFVDSSICDEVIKERVNGSYTSLFIKDSKVVGAIAFAGITEMLAYKAAIENQKMIKMQGKTIAEIISEGGEA